MKALLVGIQDMNFKTEDGSEIDGVKLHYVQPDFDGVVHGQKAVQKFVNRKAFNSLGYAVKDLIELIGAELEFQFTEKGKLCFISV